MTREVKGDLLALFQQGHYDIIAHGCNCKGIMGAGIAKTIGILYPEVKRADWRLAHSKITPWPGSFLPVPVEHGIIVNLYTQEYPGRDATNHAVYHSLRRMKQWVDNLQFEDAIRIGLPHIGCGIGGLQWDDVKEMIEGLFRDQRLVVDLVEYAPQHVPRASEFPATPLFEAMNLPDLPEMCPSSVGGMQTGLDFGGERDATD